MGTRRQGWGHRCVVLGAWGLLSATAGCSTASTDSTASDNSGDAGTRIEFDPANFVDPTLDTNLYHPLKPGTQWVYGGTTLVGGREVPHGVIVTITDVIREIDGVETVAMLSESTDSGEIAQAGMDYMALDSEGNVWILGGYTEDYEGGQYTNTEDAWLGEGKEQSVGVLVPGVVQKDTPRWFIAGAPGEAGSIGEPVDTDASACVEFDCFDGVHIIMEGEVGAPDNEHKFYAPGVGVVKNVPLDASLHKDRFELLNFTQLSPTGLTDASGTVLDLEDHARETAPHVFASGPTSKRHP